MVDGVEPLYRKVAESITGKIRDPWSTAWVDAIFYPDQIFFSCEYVSNAGDKHKSVATDIEGERAFRKIRELFRLAGKPLWGRARFELHADGKFKMDFDYDDCDESGFARFDEEKELQRMREMRERLT